MNKIFQFGEEVEGYDIRVLNEREIRAAAGILFLIMFTSILTVIFNNNFLYLKYGIVLFFTDFIIRVFINPKYAPTLIIGRLIVRNQVPEYVGARQKKFAWKIGVAMATTMLILMLVVNSFSAITGLICFICLIFLFFESAFGICLGCKFYPFFFKEKAQYCPGEICDVNSKQDIQKTSLSQLFIVLAFISFMVMVVLLLQENFSVPPHDLFGLEGSIQSFSPLHV